jgi:hypothetical protein
MMSGRHVRKVIGETYLRFRDVKRDQFAKVCAESVLPLFYLNADIWTSKTTHVKYLGVRVFWTNSKLERQSTLLTVTLYRPSFSLLEKGTPASSILYNYIRAALSNFGLDISKHVAGACSDAGSDVKAAFTKYNKGISWDWCIPHFLHVAFVKAFGLDLDPKKSINKECREMLKGARTVATKFRRSPDAASRLKEVQEDKGLKALVMSSDVSQRWASLIFMLNRLLLLWNPVMTVYSEMSELNPVSLHKKPLQELFSLCYPFLVLFKLPQSKLQNVHVECVF